jgi:hypothetical protein
MIGRAIRRAGDGMRKIKGRSGSNTGPPFYMGKFKLISAPYP